METYERPAVAGSGKIATGLAACASVASKVIVLARSDASAWKAEEQAHALSAKVDGGDAKRIKVTTVAGDLYSVKERARIQGWLSSVWGIAGVIGPAIGGFLPSVGSGK